MDRHSLGISQKMIMPPLLFLLICQHDFYLQEQEAECVKMVDYRPTNELHSKGYQAEAINHESLPAIKTRRVSVGVGVGTEVF